MRPYLKEKEMLASRPSDMGPLWTNSFSGSGILMVPDMQSVLGSHRSDISVAPMSQPHRYTR